MSLSTKSISTDSPEGGDNGRKLIMHPEVARAFERQIAAQMDQSIERAIMTGKL